MLLQSFADACEKSEFAQLDYSQNDFRLTINQKVSLKKAFKNDLY